MSEYMESRLSIYFSSGFKNWKYNEIRLGVRKEKSLWHRIECRKKLQHAKHFNFSIKSERKSLKAHFDWFVLVLSNY